MKLIINNKSILLLLLLAFTAGFGCEDGTSPRHEDPDSEQNQTPDTEPDDPPDGKDPDVKSCTSDESCNGKNMLCVEGRCVPKTCDHVQCSEGETCNPETLGCENFSQCSVKSDCKEEDEVCLFSKCVRKEHICETLNCEATRGVCSEDDLECVDAKSCTKNRECLQGNFCNIVSGSIGSCEDSQCESDTGERKNCTETGGVCDPVTGDCVNKTSCATNNDCQRSGFVCVKSDGAQQGQCVGKDDPCQGTCGVEGSRLVCEYDEENFKAKCTEVSCQLGIDCREDRVCEALSGTCTFPGNCQPDAFESGTGPVPFFDSADASKTLSDLTLCALDEDIFVVDTSHNSVPDLGRLVVTLQVTKGLGNGGFTMALLDENNAPIGSPKVVKAHEMRGQDTFVLTYDMPSTDSGKVYKFKVTAQDVKPTLTYNLNLDLVSQDIVSMCQSVPTVVPGIPEQADLSQGVSVFKPSCTSQSSTGKALAYTLHLTKRSYTTLTLNGLIQSSITLFESDCMDVAKADEVLCEYQSPGTPTVSKILEPGDYTVMVSTWDTGASADFSLEVTAEETTCTPADDKCVGSELFYCPPTQIALESTTCDDGCDNVKKACSAVEYDNCTFSGPPITKDPTTHIHRATYNLADFKKDYNPASCGSVRVNESDLEDMVFRVQIPDNYVVEAKVNPLSTTRSDDFALYLLDDQCSSDTCIASTDENTTSGREYLIWPNRTGSQVEYFLVVDGTLNGPDHSHGVFELDITVKERICDAKQEKCERDATTGKDHYLKCDVAGTSYLADITCDQGCSTSTSQLNQCNAQNNDYCNDAESLLPGVPKVVDLRFYQYSALGKPSSDACDGTVQTTGFNSGGNEAYYELVVEANKVAKIVTTPLVNENFTTWIAPKDACVSNGLNYDMQAKCLDVDSVVYSRGPGAIVIPPQSHDRTFLVVVEPTSVRSYTPIEDGLVKLEAEVADPCQVGAVLGCSASNDAILICDENQLVHHFMCDYGGSRGVCSGSGAGATCVPGGGRTCRDPKLLRDSSATVNSGRQSGNFSKNNKDQVNFLEVSEPGWVGACEFLYDTGSVDSIYQFELKAGERLTVDYGNDNPSSAEEASVFFLQDCGDLNTCSGLKSGGNSHLEYWAEQDQTLFLVVDFYRGYLSGGGNFWFDWEVTKQSGQICNAGASVCSGTTSKTCSADGLSWEHQYDCSLLGGATCNPLNGKCEFRGNDTCQQAAILPTSAFFPYGTEVSFVHNPGSAGFTDAMVACGGVGGRGKDAFYKVTLQPMQILTVKLLPYATVRPAMYLLKDEGNCDLVLDSPVCLKKFEVSYTAATGPEELVYHSDQGGDYILVIDYRYPSDNSYPISIKVDAADCSADQVLCDSADAMGKTVKYCEDGRWATYECPGTGALCANTPQGVTCNPATGNTCFDAKPLVATHQNSTGAWVLEDQSWVDGAISATNDMEFPLNDRFSNGKCFFDSDIGSSGVERIYSIDLLEDDLFKFKATFNNRGTKAFVYILDACGEGQFCQVAAKEDGGNVQLNFVAPHDGTYYIVVDRTSRIAPTSNLTYDFLWKVEHNFTCVPDSTTCDGDNLVVCDSTGKQPNISLCPNTCFRDKCIPFDYEEIRQCDITATRYDTDFKWEQVNRAQLIHASDYDGMVPNGVDLTQNPNKGPDRDWTAGDAYINVKIPAHATITVKVKTQAKDYHDILIALLNACPTKDSKLEMERVLVAGMSQYYNSSGVTATFTYTNPDRTPLLGTLYIDGSSDSINNPYEYVEVTFN